MFIERFINIFFLVNPVVIIPGYLGSKMYAKFKKPAVLHWFCDQKHTEWHRIWFTAVIMGPILKMCWTDNIKLLWNPNTNKYSNNCGVLTKIPYRYGSTKNFEWLDNIKIGASNYFYSLVESLVTVGGVRNVSIRGAPYDFRYAPYSVDNGTWVDRMTSLVEDTYNINNRTPVTLLSHSMGCLYTLYFLNRKDSHWKDRYIKYWIPTAGPFAGAVLAMKSILRGDDRGIPFVSSRDARESQRSWESTMFLVPTHQVWGTTAIVQTPTKNYSALQYKTLFKDANITYGYERYQLVRNLTASLIHPLVDTIHLYGTGIPTAESIVNFDGGKFERKETTIINGDGDGTVNTRSMKSILRRWKQREFHHLFLEIQFPGHGHVEILKSKEYIERVIHILKYTPNSTNILTNKVNLAHQLISLSSELTSSYIIIIISIMCFVMNDILLFEIISP